MYNREQVRIEQSVDGSIPQSMFNQLQSAEPLLVSGQPLLHVPADPQESITVFDDCAFIEDEQVIVQRVYRYRLPILGHRHINERYIDPDGYPAVQCFTFSGDEIIFGIKASLPFSIKSRLL